ncbi:hypothetical protein [Streptomyces tsukubensis]|uniref:N-acetyltransferase domain-containing protein n=1 Tax=Streptomyces tsukubensis TaxID=83656 RepID=A0A1V4A9B9_9ACTN|nr:hypothetical protein [Streptomyces tsukubensis]OON79163.1 hypothetical protein B1H18_14380 [Streptomyces tsukubensis]QFR94726.1 hypothetical protein GBW32_18840 [Streptomyces tsukubensis]
MSEVFLRRLTRWQAEQQRQSVADVYVKAYGRASGTDYRDRGEFLSRFERDMQRPGFDMVVAGAATLAACVYGYGAARSGEWWRGFQGSLPLDVEELTVSGRAFVLAELMVVPAHRGAHVATRIQQHLLVRHADDLVIALVEPSDSPALAVVSSWEWSKLGMLDAAPGAPAAFPASATRTPIGPPLVPHEVWIRRPRSRPGG